MKIGCYIEGNNQIVWKIYERVCKNFLCRFGQEKKLVFLKHHRFDGFVITFFGIFYLENVSNYGCFGSLGFSTIS